MSRADGPATDAEVAEAFDRLLYSADQAITTDTGVDRETMAAIQRYWDAPSPGTERLARYELELQLDGTHARAAEARQAALFNTP